MLQAESSSSLLCLWTGRSLPAAPHPVSRRRSCLPLRTDQCFCPMGTFRRHGPSGETAFKSDTHLGGRGNGLCLAHFCFCCAVCFPEQQANSVSRIGKTQN